MPKYNNKGPNLFGNYFSSDSAIYQIVEGMQQGHRKFDAGLVERAKLEVHVKSKALDASTYPFAQDLYHHLYGRRRGRVILLVQGVFHGTSDIESIVPIDLGNNPHQLFFYVGNTTIDQYVTFEQTGRFINRIAWFLYKLYILKI